MKLIQTKIPDVVIIEPELFHDDRGWFMESFNEAKFHTKLNELNLPAPSHLIQDNHSYSQKNVLRGLHYQLPPFTQGKLVRVTQGKVYDVVVDVRENSPTFGVSVGVELSAQNHRMLWIPEGFAHGFLTLEDDTHFLYKTTNYYNKANERTLKWNDPALEIDWPVSDDLLINEKDATAPLLSEIEPINLDRNVSTIGLFPLKEIGDHRGKLVVMEKNCNLPFELQRVYYIFATKKEVMRGFHAHKNLQQVAVCIAGQCRMILDDGHVRTDFLLDSPTKGLYISNMLWREMYDFSDDCVLCVFANECYDESDYIRNYDDFLREIKNEQK